MIKLRKLLMIKTHETTHSVSKIKELFLLKTYETTFD